MITRSCLRNCIFIKVSLASLRGWHFWVSSLFLNQNLSGSFLLLFSLLSHVQLFVTPWTGVGMPGFPVLHYLPESAQTPVHSVGDTIQPSHLLLMPSVFTSVRIFSNELTLSASASVLPMNIQGWFPVGLTCLISLLSKGRSRVFSSTTVQKLTDFSIALSLLYAPTVTSIHDYWKNHSFD